MEVAVALVSAFVVGTAVYIWNSNVDQNIARNFVYGGGNITEVVAIEEGYFPVQVENTRRDWDNSPPVDQPLGLISQSLQYRTGKGGSLLPSTFSKLEADLYNISEDQGERD